MLEMKYKLLYVIEKNGDKRSDLAEYIGCSLSTLTHKINGTKGGLTYKDIQLIQERYKLSPDEIAFIFFDNELANYDEV